MKMKPLLAVLLMIVFSAAAAAHDGDDFSEAKQLIDSKAVCSELSEGQLELMGDYYMEQMHPGEAHELMDKMMGGEGSESLKQMHISMAKRLYCNEGVSGMMGMGMMMGSGMMGSGYGMMSNGGMMNMMGNYGYGMMGGSNLFGASLLWLLYVAIGAFVFSVIFWWTYQMIVKEKGKKR